MSSQEKYSTCICGARNNVWILRRLFFSIITLQDFFIPYLEEKLWDIPHFWFQQNRQTAQTMNVSMNFNRESITGCVISMNCDIPWLPRSPDLIPCHFLLATLSSKLIMTSDALFQSWKRPFEVNSGSRRNAWERSEKVQRPSTRICWNWRTPFTRTFFHIHWLYFLPIAVPIFIYNLYFVSIQNIKKLNEWHPFQIWLLGTEHPVKWNFHEFTHLLSYLVH